MANSSIKTKEQLLIEVEQLKKKISELELSKTDENEVKLKAALESMTDAIFISDLEGNFIEFNEAFATFHKFKDKEECAKTLQEYPIFLDVFYPDGEFVPIEMWVVSRALRGETGLNKEYKIKRKDTGETWVGIYNYAPIRNSEGDIIGSVVTARDITDLKKSQQEIKIAKKKVEESEERFNLAMKASKDGLFDWNLMTNEIYYSPGWKNMLGFEDNELPNDFTIWENLTEPEDVQKSWEMQQELINKQRDRFELEFKMKHKDGHWVDILSRAEAVFDENDKAIRIVGTHVDISERKREEKILDVELKLFEYAINHSQEELLRKFLDEAERLTNSKIGFYHFIEDDQESISLQTWSSNTLNNMCEGSGEVTRHYPISKAGVWVDCIKERKPVVHNDYSSLAHKKGLPEGHANVIRELVVPVIRGNQIKAVLGVGNKESDYNENDVKSIQRFADVAWETVVRKQVEKNLKNTFDISPSIIAKADLNTGFFIEASQAVTRILGYEIDEFTSKAITEFVHPDDRQRTIDEAAEELKGKEVKFFENRYLCKDGSYNWMAWHGTKADENGIVTAIGSDINERKKAEFEIIKAKENLKESLEKYRLLHENAGLGIGYYSTDGTVISFNSIASKDMNGVPEDFAGKSIFDIFPKKYADFYFERLQKAMVSDEVEVYEDYVQLPTQRKWFLSTYTKIVNSKNEILGIQIISQNITKIKQSEVDLNSAKEKAEESDRLKSAFLANMSHEIRTPMNGILGFIGLLKNPNLTIEQSNKYSDIINKSGKRLLDTINDIIDISKIEVGEVKVTQVETSLSGLLEEVYSFYLPEATEKGLSLLYETYPKYDNTVVLTDNHKLNGILSNLVKNAIKYTDEGSISFGYKLKKEVVEFYVEDTGIGIPKNRVQAIFNRFEQADIEDKKAFEGSGLGLAISKAYAEMLGGNINVKSEDGKGSIFTFTIPNKRIMVKEIEEIPISTKFDMSRIKELTLLIAEDEDVSSELLLAYFNDVVDKIIIVRDGKEAIEECKHNPNIDLILMDVKMPRMDGYEATREIRKFNKELIIIAQTAYALPGDREISIKAGCNDYITKPIKKDELIEIINRHLS